MAHFESDAEVYDQLGGILNNLVYNSARREQLRQADAVVQFAFRQPDATVTLDMRAHKPARIDLGETKLRADVVLAMDADTGHALLTGELSPTLALARGDVRTKGPVGKVLRIVPATVGAHEVEADLEPEPEAPAVEAPAAEPEAPAENEAQVVAAEVQAEAEAVEAAAGEVETAAEPESEPEAHAAEPTPEAAAEPEAAADAEAAAPVDPPAEAEAPAES
ncbi:MAG TPA: SCP2 sterol-binding domain-containing protein [Baekduia sp.]|nr:SCP2 sterol-binding domain-containing protein [Baekduia sp.]